MKKFLFLLILAGALFFGWQKFNTASHLETVKPKRGGAVEAVYATGTVEPSVMIPISPRTSGRITALLADEGQDVKKGTVLAKLEDNDVEKTLAELRARAALADKEFKRKAALLERGAVPRSVYDQAVGERDAARAAVGRGEAEIAFLHLSAPEDGIIIRRDGEAGQLVPAGQAVFWMACCAPLRISAEVDEEDISRVKVGQAVVISADAYPDQVFKGTVQSITPKGDAVSRSYRVRVALDGETPLMIGMTAETNIVIAEREDALQIPLSALDGGRVWTVDGGKLKPVNVKSGARGKDRVEITEGLADDTFVVLDPDKTFRAGKSVKATETDWQMAE